MSVKSGCLTLYPSPSGGMVRPTGDALPCSAHRGGRDEPSHLGEGWALFHRFPASGGVGCRGFPSAKQRSGNGEAGGEDWEPGAGPAASASGEAEGSGARRRACGASSLSAGPSEGDTQLGLAAAGLRASSGPA